MRVIINFIKKTRVALGAPELALALRHMETWYLRLFAESPFLLWLFSVEVDTPGFTQEERSRALLADPNNCWVSVHAPVSESQPLMQTGDPLWKHPLLSFTSINLPWLEKFVSFHMRTLSQKVPDVFRTDLMSWILEFRSSEVPSLANQSLAFQMHLSIDQRGQSCHSQGWGFLQFNVAHQIEQGSLWVFEHLDYLYWPWLNIWRYDITKNPLSS